MYANIPRFLPKAAFRLFHIIPMSQKTASDQAQKTASDQAGL